MPSLKQKRDEIEPKVNVTRDIVSALRLVQSVPMLVIVQLDIIGKKDRGRTQSVWNC